MSELPTHEFILRITPPSDTEEQILDKLYEAGCGGFTYSVSNGIHEIICYRQANSITEAMQTAIKQVEEALGVQVALVLFDQEEDFAKVNPFGTSTKGISTEPIMPIFCDCGHEYFPLYARDRNGDSCLILYPCPFCVKEAADRAFETGKRIGYTDGRAASLTDKF